MSACLLQAQYQKAQQALQEQQPDASIKTWVFLDHHRNKVGPLTLTQLLEMDGMKGLMDCTAWFEGAVTPATLKCTLNLALCDP